MDAKCKCGRLIPYYGVNRCGSSCSASNPYKNYCAVKNCFKVLAKNNFICDHHIYKWENKKTDTNSKFYADLAK